MKKAFTLSEVLITLGIIGVVASMTLPALVEKHKKITTVSKLKKAYTSLSQMLISSNADNGPAPLVYGDNIEASVTENFFNTYWLQYFKAPIAAKNLKTFYQISNVYTFLNGNKYGVDIRTDYGAGRILFKSQDGTMYFMAVGYWDKDIPKYASEMNVLVDINGAKKPNMLGYDVFFFIINYKTLTIRPNGAKCSKETINESCSKTGSGAYCTAKIMNANWQIEKDYPW